MSGYGFEEYFEKVRGALNGIASTISFVATAEQRLGEEVAAIGGIIHSKAQQITKVFRKLEPFSEQVKKAFETLPETHRKALEVFAANGWHPESELPLDDLVELVELFESGEFDKAHRQLCGHYEQRLMDIEEELGSLFPHRKRVLKVAFNAHRRGEYALSIPVFLAQADGIFFERIGIDLFSRNRGKGLSDLAENFQGSRFGALISEALLSPITDETPIFHSRKERKRQGTESPKSFNRHAILHGEWCDYDTRLNGYRSIAFIAYIKWVVGDLWDEG